MAPYKDTQKELDRQKNTYFPAISVKIRKSESFIMDSLEDCVLLKKTTKAEYTKTALIEKLIRDGYLKKE